MDNSVLTRCGKEITLNNNFGVMSWKLSDQNKVKSINKAKLHMLDSSLFDNKTPSVENVENAIVAQLPKDLLTSGENETFYLLNKLYYSPNKIELKVESLQVSIPNGCWDSLELPEETINRFAYLVNQNRSSVYLDKSFNEIESENVDAFTVCFYNEWAVFYRIRRLRNGSYKILTTVMKNTNTHCKNLFKETSNEKIVKKQRYRTVTSEDSNVIILGNLIALNNCFEDSSLFKLPKLKNVIVKKEEELLIKIC
jgi:hypothetical protein